MVFGFSHGYNFIRTAPHTNDQRSSPLGRIIRTTNPTRQRNNSIKQMSTEIREYLKNPHTDGDIFQLGANLAAPLKEIRESVDRTAAAWEKRDYWLKADAFRRQWFWAEKFHSAVEKAVVSRDLPGLQQLVIELGEKLSSLKAA
jgi:hypothetical protein